MTKQKTKAEIRKELNEAVSQAKLTTYHLPEAKGKTRYKSFSDKSIFGAYTTAAFVVSGFIRLNAKSATLTQEKGNSAVLLSLLSKKAVDHWSDNDWIKDHKLTANGVNKINTRLSGGGKGQEKAYNHDVALAKAVVDAIRKGGTVKTQKQTVNFSSKLEVAK